MAAQGGKPTEYTWSTAIDQYESGSHDGSEGSAEKERIACSLDKVFLIVEPMRKARLDEVL